MVISFIRNHFKTLLFFLGSLSLLIAQQVYNPSWIDSEKDNYEEEIYNTQDTATTAVILSVFVLIISFLSLIVEVLWTRNQPQDGEQSSTAADVRKLKQWNDSSKILLLAPSIALFFILTLRLFVGANNFQGLPYYLDFGWKYGLEPHDRSVEQDGDELYNEPAEKSVAFTVEFNSYGHAIQGVLAAFLSFPVVVNFLLKGFCCCGGCYGRGEGLWIQSIWNNIIHLTPWTMLIYPTYSLIKRAKKAGEAFAASSFANNGFEWSTGFMVGLVIGNLMTAYALWRDAVKGGEDEDGANVQQQETSILSTSQSPSPWWKVWENDNNRQVEGESDTAAAGRDDNIQNNQPHRYIKILQYLLGIMHLVIVLTSAILFGITWHGCLDGSPDECVNYSEDAYSISVLVGFVVIPVLFVVGTSLMVIRQGKTEGS